MEGLQMVGLAGVFGVVAALWGKIRLVFIKLYSLVFITGEVHDYLMCKAVTAYLLQNCKCLRLGIRFYGSQRCHVRSEGRSCLVSMEYLVSPDPKVFMVGKVPILVMGGGEKSSGGGTSPSNHMIRIIVLRKTIELDTLLINAEKSFNDYTQTAGGGRRFFIRHIYGSGMNLGAMGKQEGGAEVDSDAPITESEDNFLYNYRFLSRTYEDIGYGNREREDAHLKLAFTPTMEAAYESLKRWSMSKDWYVERGIPWKRGLLLHGEPGTGKTSFIRSVMEELDFPIFVFHAATLSDSEFIKKWTSMLSSSPCAVLLEDIDTVFQGRSNISVNLGQGLTFETLLNCIDGVNKSDGIILAITTNDLSSVDPAIGIPDNGDGETSTRPGRIDVLVKMERTTLSQRKLIAARILSECPQYVLELTSAGVKDTPAQFQERCMKVALNYYWSQNKMKEETS